MIGMTVNSCVKAVNLHRPEEPLRITLYLVAQQFHLLIITLPGQVIRDHSSELSNYMYVNKHSKHVCHTLPLLSLRDDSFLKMNSPTINHYYGYVFQRNKRRASTLFDISHYKAFKKYLLFLGQYPTQSRWSSKFTVTVITGTLLTFYCPAFAQIFISLHENDLEGMLEGMPVIAAVSAVLIKLLNHEIYRKNFEKMFDTVKEDWKLLNNRSQACILEEITKQGNKIGEVYRVFVLSCMSGFIFIPLYPIFMDIILPLNETRHRQQMFRLKFFIDEEQYFYLIYFYIVWCTFATVMIAVTIDSLYIQLVHHDCALFAVCGQNVITATRSTDVGINETYTERFRQCLSMHKNALQLFEMLDVSSRRSYFFQILLTMVGMTVTAVQAVVNLHRPEEALRIGLFLVGQQFHLLIITLPGQVITDHSFKLTNDIYCSTWYKVPVKIQKILLTMHMRSNKPCKLTAGGIYEMNIENFGITFKTCVSYFTLLLSLRD